MSKTYEVAVLVTVTGASITTSGTSAGTTIPVNSAGERPRYIRVASTAAAHVRIGVGAQTAVTTDMLVQPGDAVVMAVPSGVTHVAAIQTTAAGVVIVTPMENS